jgi:endonuclease G, mitochondrial
MDLSDALSRLADGTAWRSADADRKARRAQRLSDADAAAPADVDQALERVLEEPDFRPLHWLNGGLRTARSVGLVLASAGKGTGFLVAPWLFMTNNHVLPDADTAASATVRFGYQEQESGDIVGVTSVRLDPARFFVTSPYTELDYTVVAMGPMPGSPEPPGATQGTIPLVGSLGKILEGEPVNIIQHPDGRPMEIAFRNNRMIALVDDDVMTYSTDTERGSSGAPVFNDQWELVALHRASVEATDANGRPVDRNGQPVGPLTPMSLRAWTANKGTRVSALVRHLESRSLDGDGAALIAELLARS